MNILKRLLEGRGKGIIIGTFITFSFSLNWFYKLLISNSIEEMLYFLYPIIFINILFWFVIEREMRLDLKEIKK